MIPPTYSVGADVLNLQECSLEAKNFFGNTVLRLNFNVDKFIFYFLLLRKLEAYSTKVNRDSIQYSVV